MNKMGKTLGECLLDGGVGGKTFVTTSINKIKYTIKDIHFPHMFGRRPILYVEGVEDIPNGVKALTENYYHLELFEHYQDELVVVP